MLGAPLTHTPGHDISLLDEAMDERPAQAGMRADGADLRHADPLGAGGVAIVCRQAGGVRCVVHADVDVRPCSERKSIGFRKPDRLK